MKYLVIHEDARIWFEVITAKSKKVAYENAEPNMGQVIILTPAEVDRLGTFIGFVGIR